MITLALELSSRHGSAALLSGRELLREETWHEKDVRGQRVFQILPGLLAGAAVSIEAVDLFAVGRGPGSYSGMRVAIAAAQAFALPGQKTVFTVSSGEALAQEVAEAENASRVAVVGDARRDTVWFGVFENGGRGLSQIKPWTVCAPEKLAAELPPGTLVASPDRHKLAPVLKALNVRTVETDCFPKARIVGELALRKREQGVPSEALVPIYTQPAVAKK